MVLAIYIFGNGMPDLGLPREMPMPWPTQDHFANENVPRALTLLLFALGKYWACNI